MQDLAQWIYELGSPKRLVVENELEKMLAEGMIVPRASPITLVDKKDGGIRFCTDFRKINAITKKDAHSLLHIQDIFDSLAGATVFSTLDLKAAYWQICMDDESEEKMAFMTHKDLFQFRHTHSGCTMWVQFSRVAWNKFWPHLLVNAVWGTLTMWWCILGPLRSMMSISDKCLRHYMSMAWNWSHLSVSSKYLRWSSWVSSLMGKDDVVTPRRQRLLIIWPCREMYPRSGGCFTNVSRALQNNLAKIHNTRYHIYDQNFKLKLCTCAQSMALGTHTKFQLEILITSTISAIHKFRENILESSRNGSETTPRSFLGITGYHRNHIPNYVELVCPLAASLMKHAKFVWGEPGGLSPKPHPKLCWAGMPFGSLVDETCQIRVG